MMKDYHDPYGHYGNMPETPEHDEQKRDNDYYAALMKQAVISLVAIVIIIIIAGIATLFT